MIKILLPLCLFVCCLSAKSQKKAGEATYKVIIQKDSTIKGSATLNDTYEKAIFGAKNIELKLTFSSEKAVFKLVDKLEELDDKLAIAWCNCRKTIYTDLKNNLSLYSNTTDKGIFKEYEFLITDTIKNNWEISQESKKIESFQCYKATQSVKYKTSKKEFTRLITAWFAPAIPFSFGPKGYAGLPGLILELHEGNQTYGITNLKWLDTDVAIPIPEKGTKISPYEFDLLYRKRSLEAMQTTESSVEKRK
ncbi:MAG: GLPGLI family protein [Flavobacterium sp.]|nr:MAG: GLPGLI family protein [Flavobacterium sp.]